jgi:hypothetical protein
MNILIIIYVFGVILIFTANADFRSRFLPDFFFLLAAAGVSNDAIEIVIEISIKIAASFMIKDFFTLIFDFLETGDVSKIKI